MLFCSVVDPNACKKPEFALIWLPADIPTREESPDLKEAILFDMIPWTVPVIALVAVDEPPITSICGANCLTSSVCVAASLLNEVSKAE